MAHLAKRPGSIRRPASANSSNKAKRIGLGLEIQSFSVYMPRHLVLSMDEWRLKQEDVPSKSEAVRLLLEYALESGEALTRIRTQKLSASSEDAGASHDTGTTKSRIKFPKRIVIAPGKVETLRNIVKEQLKEAGSSGLTLDMLTKNVKKLFDANVDRRVIGTTLWHTREKGFARCDGRAWFYTAPMDNEGSD